MGGSMVRAVPALFMGAALFLAACGGDKAGSTGAMPSFDPGSSTGIERYVLTPGELPKGYSAVAATCLPKETVDQNGHGLKDSCGALFSKTEGDALVYVSVQVMSYGSESDAESYVSPLNIDTVRALYQPILKGGFAVDAAEPLEVDSVGGLSSAWRMNLTSNAVNYQVGAFFLVFQEGSMVGKISIETKTKVMPDAKSLSDMARKLDAKLKASN